MNLNSSSGFLNAGCFIYYFHVDAYKRFHTLLSVLVRGSYCSERVEKINLVSLGSSSRLQWIPEQCPCWRFWLYSPGSGLVVWWVLCLWVPVFPKRSILRVYSSKVKVLLHDLVGSASHSSYQWVSFYCLEGRGDGGRCQRDHNVILLYIIHLIHHTSHFIHQYTSHSWYITFHSSIYIITVSINRQFSKS